MSRLVQIGGEMVPFRASYLGGTAVVCGTASTQVTVPAGTHMALIAARGGAIYYAVNGSSAGTTSPGYVPSDTLQPIFPVDNLASLHVAGDGAACVAHVQFYAD